MDTRSIQHLKDLSERAEKEKVKSEGSAQVVIYAAEFYALEKVLIEWEAKLHDPNKHDYLKQE